jgi:aspartate/methionine/tyrosine aminotransferase
VACVRLCGGVPVFVTLAPTGEESGSSADWKLDMGEIRASITSKTKV